MKKKDPANLGNPDQKEKERELTEAEQQRLDRFEALAGDMAEKGYDRVDLTISIVRANVFAVFLLIPLLAVSLPLFFLLSPSGHWSMNSPLPFLLLVVALAALTVLHELIHGASWAIFSEHHWKDIEFGFMKQYLTPYCTCCVPLRKGQYIFGALMPLVLVGLVPMAIAIGIGSMPLLLLGIIMADGAAGDIMVVFKILTYPRNGKEIVYMDHPTQAGGVIFEKQP